MQWPPTSTLFPYTTLFRSDDDEGVLRSIGAYFERLGAEVYREGTVKEGLDTFDRMRPDVVVLDLHLPDADGLTALRSEEHTSELQSHVNLVCRLLLEKKNK